MSETQNTSEAKIDNRVNGTTAAPAVASAPTDSAAKASVAETLRDLGILWAGVALGYGRTALESAAHALVRTAETLGNLQDKLKKADVACAPAATGVLANAN